jgi:hypothetical protein
VVYLTRTTIALTENTIALTDNAIAETGQHMRVVDGMMSNDAVGLERREGRDVSERP